MVPVALLSIVPSNVCNAIGRVACRTVLSKIRRGLVEADSLPSPADGGLCQDISFQTASHNLPETGGPAQLDSVETPTLIIDCLWDDC